ncbi:MAG: hypothetical protein ACKOTB_19070 [Planctomycetia bacterium]
MDLVITIVLIFLATSAAGYLRSRYRDPCLRSFHGFQVTLLRTDGRQVWGRMDLSPGGMEFTFPERNSDEERLKTSYLLYASEYSHIQSLVRYAERLTDAERRRRDTDMAKSFHPGPGRRVWRRLLKFLGSATDSLREVLGMVLGRVQKTQDRYVAAEGADALTKIGGTALAEVSSAHDPLLERQIGRQVVLEVLEGDEIHEHAGIFKEYSGDFLHILDVQYPQSRVVECTAERPAEHARVAVSREGDVVKVANHGRRPALVQGIEIGGGERSVDAIVEPDSAIVLAVEAGGDRVRLRLQTVCDLDMIVPRARATIRNRAEQAADVGAESIWDLVFDMGRAVRVGGDEADEERLRARLAEAPDDPHASAALGSLLLRRQDLSESGRWLRTAYNGRDSLPDGGRRVRMQLRELARRMSQRGHESRSA